MAGEIERRRGGGLHLGHAAGVLALAAVGVVVALWVLSAIAHLILGALSAVVFVALIVGVLWLVVGRGRRHNG